MPTIYNHIGELVSADVNHRFRALTERMVTRDDIKRVILKLPDGKEIEVPVETRVQVEY